MIVANMGQLEIARVRLGMSKSEFASRVGVNHSVIVRAEQGRSVSPRTSKAICDCLGVSFDEIFTIRSAPREVASDGQQ